LLDTFLGDFLEAFGDRSVHGRGELDIEAAPDEGQTEGFGGQFGELDADATADAFAWLEDDAAWLEVLLEGAAVGAEPVGIGAVDLGVVLQDAITGGATVAVETASGFTGCLGG